MVVPKGRPWHVNPKFWKFRALSTKSWGPQPLLYHTFIGFFTPPPRTVLHLRPFVYHTHSWQDSAPSLSLNLRGNFCWHLQRAAVLHGSLECTPVRPQDQTPYEMPPAVSFCGFFSKQRRQEVAKTIYCVSGWVAENLWQRFSSFPDLPSRACHKLRPMANSTIKYKWSKTPACYY